MAASWLTAAIMAVTIILLPWARASSLLNARRSARRTRSRLDQRLDPHGRLAQAAERPLFHCAGAAMRGRDGVIAPALETAVRSPSIPL
jgi:hypothetical protein